MNPSSGAAGAIAIGIMVVMGSMFSISLILSIVGMIHVATSGGRVVGMGRSVAALVLSLFGPGLAVPLFLLVGSRTAFDGTSRRVRIGPFEFNRDTFFDAPPPQTPFVYSNGKTTVLTQRTVEFVTKTTLTGETEADVYRTIADRLKDRGVSVDPETFEMRFNGFAVKSTPGAAANDTSKLLKSAQEIIRELVDEESIPKGSLEIKSVRERAP